jgi:TonB family protein
MTDETIKPRNSAALAASLLAILMLILAAPPVAGQSSNRQSQEESSDSKDLGSYSVGAPSSRSSLDSDIEEMERPELDRGSFQLNQNDMALDPNFGSSDMDLDIDINPSRAEEREDRRAVENERRLSREDLSSDNLEDQDVRPIRVDAPRYPGRAHRRGIEGFAIVEFVVDTRGRTRNVRVVESSPGDVFEDPAREAVEAWEFEPRIVDGRPVATEIRQTIEFSRDN